MPSQIRVALKRVYMGCGLILGLSTIAFGAAAAVDKPTLNELENLSYQGIYTEPVTLKDGQFVGKPFDEGGSSRPRVTLLKTTYRAGDLNGDGGPEAVVLLAENSGGSGVQIYLAVVEQVGGNGKNIATASIGDRVQIRSLEITAGQIQLHTIVAGPDDAACCPSEKVAQTFGLEGDKLVKLDKKNSGPLSLQDLQGQTWRLSHFARNEPVEQNLEITANFADGKITGTSGCNKYFAATSGASAYEFKVSPAGGTRMACPTPQMNAEDRYLSLLLNSNQFGFRLGNLAISYQDGEIWDTLLFGPSN